MGFIVGFRRDFLRFFVEGVFFVGFSVLWLFRFLLLEIECIGV